MKTTTDYCKHFPISDRKHLVIVKDQAGKIYQMWASDAVYEQINDIRPEPGLVYDIIVSKK